jgi:hypothetical protein
MIGLQPATSANQNNNFIMTGREFLTRSGLVFAECTADGGSQYVAISPEPKESGLYTEIKYCWYAFKSSHDSNEFNPKTGGMLDVYDFVVRTPEIEEELRWGGEVEINAQNEQHFILFGASIDTFCEFIEQAKKIGLRLPTPGKNPNYVW